MLRALDAVRYGDLREGGAAVIWSPERRRHRRWAAANGELERKTRTREGGEKRGGALAPQAHQEHEELDGEAGKRPETTAGCSTERGRRRRRSERPGRLGPARDNSLGVEVEDGGAELVVAFDLDGEVLSGGDAR